MSNIFYRPPMVEEKVGEHSQGKVLQEFLQLIAPKRPQFKFIVASFSECFVYHGVMDITCKDTKSVNYIGEIGFAGSSRRGGKGYRPTIKVVPAGRSRLGCKETVSLSVAAKIFLTACTARSLEVVAGHRAAEAAGVVRRARAATRFTILNGLNKMFSQLSEPELARYTPSLFRWGGTPGLVLNYTPDMEQAAEKLRELCKVFGARHEHMAAVVQSGEKYVVQHSGELVEYTSDTLPPHIACAVGMLKIAGVEQELLPGYGMLTTKDVYAVSIEEVVV
jgi:hypothetical protein